MSRFAAVPTAALDDERLEALHIRVLTALCSYADKDGWCRVGQDKIALRARTNPARVSQCIKDLSDWGWMRRQRVGKMKVNVYQVLMDCEMDASIDLPTEQEQIADTANQVTYSPSKSPLPSEQITLAASANPIGTPSSNTVSNTPASSADARVSAMDRILKACGPGMLDPTKSPSPMLDLRARVGRWLEAWSLEDEILPVVEAKTSGRRQRPMSHFGFIEEDIAAFHATRLKPLPALELIHETAALSRIDGGNAGAGPSRPGNHAHGARSQGAGGQPRSGNLATSAAWLRRMREEAAGVPDESEDRRDDWVA